MIKIIEQQIKNLEQEILDLEQDIIKKKFKILKLKGGVNALKVVLEKNNELEQTLIEGILVKDCPICGITFNTLEQRKIYCSNACKTKSCRAKIKC